MLVRKQKFEVLTKFENACFFSARIYTIFLDSADPMLLTNFISSTILCTAVYVSVLYFKKPKMTRVKSSSFEEIIGIENHIENDELVPLNRIEGRGSI